MASYEFYLTSDTGVRLALLTGFTRASFNRVANDVGTLTMEFSDSEAAFDRKLLTPDRMIQVWRQPKDGAMSLWRVYFVRKWIYTTEGSAQRVTIVGYDSNVILKWRVVAYDAGEDQTKITDNADDIIKKLSSENLGGSAVAARDWSAYVSEEADLSDGESVTIEAQWQNVLEAAQSLCEASREAGTLLWFDIVPDNVTTTSITFVLRTYTEQPGVDRTVTTGMQTVFDQRRGNMREPYYEEDFTEEATYVYVGGQGELSDRQMVEAENTSRSGLSVWGRKEVFADASSQTASGGLTAAAYAALREGMPKIRFSAMAVDTAGTRFGREWNYGDKVVAKYNDLTFNAIITMVSIDLEGEDETVTARLEYEY